MLQESELIKLLECPVCMDFPIPPITNCFNGHIICNFCRSKISHCGICSTKFTESRNFLAEAIIEASEFQCQYEGQGCSDIISGSMMKTHMLDCEFRPLTCCDQRNVPCYNTIVEFTDFIRHLKTIHKCDGFDKEQEYYDKIEKSSLKNGKPWCLFYITFDNRNFLKHTYVKKSIIYWWITLLGSKADAAKYTAIITILPKDKNSSMKIEFTVPVHNIRKPFNEIKENSSCASIPKDYILPFCIKNFRTPLGIYNFAWHMVFKLIKN